MHLSALNEIKSAGVSLEMNDLHPTRVFGKAGTDENGKIPNCFIRNGRHQTQNHKLDISPLF